MSAYRTVPEPPPTGRAARGVHVGAVRARDPSRPVVGQGSASAVGFSSKKSLTTWPPGVHRGGLRPAGSRQDSA